jgi:hypothetical protein
MNAVWLNVTMPDDSIWQVPVYVIALNRARCYKISFDHDVSRSLHEDTIPLFSADAAEIIDWAANNMDWADVAPYAVLKKKPAVDYQEGWMNGDKSVSAT